MPSTLARAQASGFLRVGYSQEAPYAFLTPDGTVRGDSPEAMRAIVQDLGVDSIRWVRLDFEDLVPVLLAGRVDVVASGLFRTPERERVVGFSHPTLCARAAMVALADGGPVGGIATFAGPEGTDRLAVLEGSVEERAAERLEVPPDRMVVVPDVATGIAALRLGQVRSIALTAPTARKLAADEKGLEWWTYRPSPEIQGLVSGCSALAVRSEDQDLLAALDRALTGYVGSPRHIAALEDLGLEPGDLPGKLEATP